MQITWYGHSCFLLASESGYSILTDPCDPETGYELHDLVCNAVTISHEHHDHNCLAIVAGTPEVFREGAENGTRGVCSPPCSLPLSRFIATPDKSRQGRSKKAQRFIAGATAIKSTQPPDGRKKSLQVLLHIFHPVLLQENLKLFLECHLPVMLRLPLNVFRRVLHAGDTDAEGPVAFLPLEVPMLFERVMNPLRRVSLEKLNGFRHGKRGRNREQDMNMSFHAAYDQRPHLVLPSDAAEVGPKTLLQIRFDERTPIFGGPNAMHQATDEGVHTILLRSISSLVRDDPKIAHRFNGGQPIPTCPQAPPGRKKSPAKSKMFCRPWRDLSPSRPEIPAMNRWAIVFRPAGLPTARSTSVWCMASRTNRSSSPASRGIEDSYAR